MISTYHQPTTRREGLIGGGNARTRDRYLDVRMPAFGHSACHALREGMGHMAHGPDATGDRRPHPLGTGHWPGPKAPSPRVRDPPLAPACAPPGPVASITLQLLRTEYSYLTGALQWSLPAVWPTDPFPLSLWASTSYRTPDSELARLPILLSLLPPDSTHSF